RITVRRDTSGRSGRRRGSQKPGTAWGAASVPGFAMLCADAEPGSATASNADSARMARRPRDDRACEDKAIRDCIENGLLAEVDGLIDHPADNANGGLRLRAWPKCG